ncbi:hypothetical protein [Vibrio phage vB_VmeM-Yong XC32]|nr:hypothetical protein [Vibrio phage vB_VmeM-Yong XC31]QAX96554.1 hypothetical protein [Vibrio phage vB_VmeM-Yong XC32]QAX96872.1 hypothetical protein [Vibrio phage vB_VmeM-Yong MS31]QAX97177.1 hypothetical protein [Vibrio phage vB_VmeM-Yong MS32]
MIQVDFCKLLDSRELGRFTDAEGLFDHFNKASDERKKILTFLKSIETAERYSLEKVHFNDALLFLGSVEETEKVDLAWLKVHRPILETGSNFKVLIVRVKGETVWSVYGLDVPTFDGYLRKSRTGLDADKFMSAVDLLRIADEDRACLELRDYYENTSSKDIGDDIVFTTERDIVKTLKIWYRSDAILTVSPATLKWITDAIDFMLKVPQRQPIGDDNLMERLK